MDIKSFVANGYNDHLIGGDSSEARTRGVRELSQSSVLRLASIMLDDAVKCYAYGVRRRQLQDARRRGFEFIGSGAESEVIHDIGRNVVNKCVKSSIQMDEAGRTQLAATKTEQFEVLQDELSAYVGPQQIHVAAHPLYPRARAVQTEQPYIDYVPLVRPTHDRRGLQTYFLEALSGDVKDQLSNFVDASERLYVRHRLLPDTNGDDNLVINETGRLTLLDTQPITEADLPVQDLIRQQLQSVARSL